MTETGQEFVFITTLASYQEISEAAMKRQMSVVDYVTFAIKRQILEDQTGLVSSKPEENEQ